MKTIQDIKNISNEIIIELKDKGYEVPEFKVVDKVDRKIIFGDYIDGRNNLVISLKEYLKGIAQANKSVHILGGGSFEDLELKHTLRHEIIHFILGHSKLKKQLLIDIQSMQMDYVINRGELCGVYFGKFDWIMPELGVENILFQDFQDEYLNHLNSFSEDVILELGHQIWFQKYIYLTFAEEYFPEINESAEVKRFKRKFERIFFGKERSVMFKAIYKDESNFDDNIKQTENLVKIITEADNYMDKHISNEMKMKKPMYSDIILNGLRYSHFFQFNTQVLSLTVS